MRGPQLHTYHNDAPVAHQARRHRPEGLECRGDGTAAAREKPAETVGRLHLPGQVIRDDVPVPGYANVVQDIRDQRYLLEGTGRRVVADLGVPVQDFPPRARVLGSHNGYPDALFHSVATKPDTRRARTPWARSSNTMDVAKCSQYPECRLTTKSSIDVAVGFSEYP